VDIFQSIIMGIVEGFTEFLPVSSTGHMIVTADFLGIKQDNVTKAYEVIIQFAAILPSFLSLFYRLLVSDFCLPSKSKPSLALMWWR